MSIPLLKALEKYCKLVAKAAKSPAIVIPSELDFVPGPQDDLESMIWVLTYAIMLRHQESLQGSRKYLYKSRVVDKYYGALSYSGLVDMRKLMMYNGCDPSAREPEGWIPNAAECRWFRRAMTLVYGRSTKEITFDAFDALCNEFINDK
jgi:hypothetical protein